MSSEEETNLARMRAKAKLALLQQEAPAAQPAPAEQPSGFFNRLESAAEVSRREGATSLGRTLASLGGLKASAGQGYVPFYDEIKAGVQAVADPSVYGEGRDLGERYDYARRLEKARLDTYRKENPGKAFVAEMGASLASPLNKLGPVTPGGGGLVNALKGFGQNMVRNSAEGSLYGLGEGEGDNRYENALDAGVASAGITSVLDPLGRGVGKVLDTFKMPESLRGPDGEFMPLPLANPGSIRAGLIRQLAKLPGAGEELAKQAAPYMQRANDVVDAVGRKYDEATDALYKRIRKEKGDVKTTARTGSDALDERLAAESRAESIAADEAAQGQYVLRQTIAQQEAADAAAREAASLQNRQRLSVEALKEGVPEARRGNVTQPGVVGFRQALNEVNAAYDEAWGKATNLAPGTAFRVAEQARAVQEVVSVEDQRKIEAFIRNVEKLGEENGAVGTLDEVLRGLRDSANGYDAGQAIEAIRTTLREGLPQENRTLLREVDKGYPALLGSQGANASAGLLAGGLPTVEQYAQSVNRVAGQRRSALGEQPLREVIQRFEEMAPPPPRQIPTPPPEPKTPKLEKSLAAKAERQRIAREAQDRREEIAHLKKIETDRIAAERKAELEPAAAKRDATKRDIGGVSDSIYFARAMAGLLPTQGNTAAKIGLASYLGSLALKPGGQELIAGQGKRTRQLADAIRSGRSEYVTRGVARNAAILANRNKDEEQ
jgi:hypothetical protein